jgi:hypothetical protein
MIGTSHHLQLLNSADSILFHLKHRFRFEMGGFPEIRWAKVTCSGDPAMCF